MSSLSSLEQLEQYLSHPPHLSRNSNQESLRSVRLDVARPAGSRIETYFHSTGYGTFGNGNSGRVKVRRVRRVL